MEDWLAAGADRFDAWVDWLAATPDALLILAVVGGAILGWMLVRAVTQ